MKHKLTSILLLIAVLFGTFPAGPALSADPEPDLENDYTLLDWQPVGSAYWMSTEPNLPTQLISKANKPNGTNFALYVSSGKMFTRDEIPAGSIIEIDAGYQYRPEGWKALEKQDARPNNVQTPRVVVDEAWWGDYTYRAFNISSTANQDIGGNPAAVEPHFRIYVPKDPENPDQTPTPTPTVTPTETPDITPTPNPSAPPKDQPLKILAIGNSFSEDAMAHLYNIATSLGYSDVVLGNLMIGGSTLAVHAGHMRTEKALLAEDPNAKLPAPYTLQKHVKGVQNNYRRSLKTGIENEDWDFITLQQGSGSSGMPDTYGDLDELVDYVLQYATNPDVKIGWQLTWAYQQDSGHNEFGNYNRDQMTMYKSIVNAVQTKVLTNPSIDFVIPSGTAVQNVRTSYIGDTLTRDTYHMSYNLGRYIVGLTWFKAITGQSIDGITWVPSSSDIPEQHLKVVKEAVNNACANPYQVTESSYPPGSVPTPKPEVDYSQYELLDFEIAVSAYWNPTHATLYNQLITKDNEPDKTKDNFKYFITNTQRFTRADIPLGSIIEVDPGYLYRPDFWLDDGRQATRYPKEVDTQRVYVDAAWWGDYQYRSFNISTDNPKEDISGKAEEVRQHFRIYVPKHAYAAEVEVSGQKAAALFSKLAESQGADVFALAVYNGNQLVKINTVQKETMLFEEVSLTVDGVEDGYTVKAFVWDGFDTLAPLCE